MQTANDEAMGVWRLDERSSFISSSGNGHKK